MTTPLSPEEFRQFKTSFKNTLSTDGFEVHLMKKDGDSKHKLLKLNPAGDLELVGRRGLSNVFTQTRKIPARFNISATPIGNTSIIKITDDMGENNWVLGARPEDRDILLVGLSSLKASSPRSLSKKLDKFVRAKPIHLVDPEQHQRTKLEVIEENMETPSSSRERKGERRVYLGEEGRTPRATVFFNKDSSDMEEFPAYRPTSGSRRSSLKKTSSYASASGKGLRRTKHLKHGKKNKRKKHTKKRRGKGTRKK
jgi:hypothetical protein